MIDFPFRFTQKSWKSIFHLWYTRRPVPWLLPEMLFFGFFLGVASAFGKGAGVQMKVGGEEEEEEIESEVGEE